MGGGVKGRVGGGVKRGGVCAEVPPVLGGQGTGVRSEEWQTERAPVDTL